MPEMDFWFFHGSTYTYLTVNRIEEAAGRAGISVRWRPYNLRVFLRETGVTFFPPGSSKAEYMWRDLERRAERLGIPFNGRPPYPVDPDLKAFRVATLAAREGWAPAYMKAHYRSWFLDGKAPGAEEHTEEVLDSLGRDSQAVLAATHTDEITALIDAEVAEARRLKLWGSPHFVVGGEVFWGDDRLEDALEWATSKHRSRAVQPEVARS
ncbi:DsbA family protein [Micromonospora sp. STR1s_5]|nr:DsbA family protein [Micromonospora sp. STR1s_5]